MNGLERFKKCPKCGKPSKCLKGDKGIICMTQWSSKTIHCEGVGDGFFHPYDDDVRPAATAPAAAKPRTSTPAADRRAWSKVFTIIIDLLVLDEGHRRDNASRGIDPAGLGYRSLTKARRKTLSRTLPDRTGLRGDSLLKIPGFLPDTYKPGEIYLGVADGLLVPCRNRAGDIHSLKIRLDEDRPDRWRGFGNAKTTTNPPVVHWPLGSAAATGPAGQVLVVEGERKSDVVFHALAKQLKPAGPVGVVGIPGVASYEAVGLADELKAAELQCGGKPPVVVVCFDSDHQTNPSVAKALIGLVAYLRTAGLETWAAVWPPEHGKGLDDYLLAGHQYDIDPSFLKDEDLNHYLDDLSAKFPDPGVASELVDLHRLNFDQQPPEGDQEPEPVQQVGGMTPFPLECLPEAVADFVALVAPDIGVDPAALALPAVGCLAGLIGLKRSASLQDSFHAWPCLWIALVMDSGDRKSAAINAVLQPFRALNRKRVTQYEDDRRAWEKALSDWNDQPPGERGPKPEEPKPKTFLIGDITVEAIKEKMGEHAQGLLMAHDELANWTAAWTKYGKGESNESEYLPMHDGWPVTHRRKGTGSKETHIDNALLSIVGGIQPGVLARVMTAERQQSGMVPRILLANPPRVKKHFVVGGKTVDQQKPIDRAKFAFNELVERLGDLSRVDEPMAFRREAEDLLVVEMNRREDQVDGADAVIKSCLSKNSGTMLRFAIIHAVCRKMFSEPTNRFIDRVDVEAAITFTNWIEREQQRVHGRLVETRDRHENDDILQWIAGVGDQGVTPRDLMLSTVNRPRKTRFPDSETAKRCLEDLKVAGRLELVVLKTGGRDRHAYRYPRNNRTEHTQG